MSPRSLPILCVLALLGALTAPAGQAAPVCGRHDAAAPALQRLAAAMAQGRFVAYQPTQIRMIAGRASRADATGIRADLQALRPRFDSLITYGAGNGADQVVDVAAQLGYRAVILGIWSIDDEGEIALALAAAARRPALVVGLSLGNERVYARETDFPALSARIERLRRRAPQLALTTTEPFHLFDGNAAQPLLATADFLLVNVHPVFQPWFAGASDADAARFVVNVTNDLAARFCGPLLVKETGVPTAPPAMGYTRARQAGFYRALRTQFPPTARSAFAYFSAFDALWRVNDAHPSPGPQPQEGSWGLFDEARRPKPAALELPLLKPQR
jgi:exo-beta-1,3-glucanase (GH17 family)